MPKQLLLGTAMWGWTVAEKQCFALLDRFYELGGRAVDNATNYPINKIPTDFRAAENILAEWIKINGIDDLEIMMKVGSVNNMRTPDHNLSPSFLLLNANTYRARFGDNLKTLMIHWDNRSDTLAIEESLSALQTWLPTGMSLGLSGIKEPAIYQSVLATLAIESLPIQCKHNLVYSDLTRYEPLHSHGRFIAYGINAGGLKLDEGAYRKDASLLARGGVPQAHQDLVRQLRDCVNKFSVQVKNRPTPATMNQLGMLYALENPLIHGVLLGVSRTEQLEQSWKWVTILSTHDYTDLYQELITLTASAEI